MAGLFDTFTIAKRGLFVQQSSINTTSHNIANANTTGYSRQRSVAETTTPFGGNSRFDTTGAGQVGTGAEITSIQRIRDSFIDYQVRSETGTSGYYTQASNTLSKVEDIFGEPSDTGIQELTNQFFNAFQEVSKSPDKSDVKTVAIKDASALADALNYAYNQLKKSQDDSQSLLKTNVTDVNSYLDQINELNKQIRGIASVGQTANDLMDKRDNLLDELSYKFGIKVDKDNLDTINLSSTEYPDSPLVKSDPNDTDYSRLSYVKNAVANPDGTVDVEYYPLGNENAPTKSFTVTATSSAEAKDLADNLMQNRILIGDKDGNVVQTTESTVGPTTVSFPVTVPADGTVDNGDGTETVTKTTTAGSISTTIITTSPKTAVIPSTTTVKTITQDTSASTATETTNTTIEDSPTTAAELSSKTFQTYKYESGVNNVDNNHVRGDIAANQSVQETIKGYMDSLDRLAAGLAYSVNAIQTGSLDVSAASQGLQNNLIFTNSTYKLTSTDITALQSELNSTTPPPSTTRAAELNKLISAGVGSAAYKKADGTITTPTDTGITAANIKVNSDLVTNPNLLNCGTSSTGGVGDGNRANAIANLSSMKMNLSNVGATEDLSTMTRKEFLEEVGINDGSATPTGFSDSNCLTLNAGTNGSTVDSYYKTIINNLATTTQEADRQVDNQAAVLSNLNDQKASVSGVSLDEEMTNLIQFQHAYQANAKMISTIDELLDVVINGLKR